MPKNQVKATELRTLKAFDSLSDPQLETIARNMVRRVYQPGQFIFLEGSESIGLWFILEGNVKIIKQSSSGRMQGLCLVNRGKCFGSCPLFSEETNPADAQALDTVTLAILPRDAVQSLIYSDAAIAIGLLKVYNERTSLLAHLGQGLGIWPVGMRINDCLIAHANIGGKIATVELTHEEIATMAGTVREVVTRHLSELETGGLVTTAPGQITIYDIAALREPCLQARPAKAEE